MPIQFYPIRVQAAFFLTTVDLSSKFNLAAAVREKVDVFAKADPIILPLPADAPTEFPHIVIEDKDSGWALQIAPSRFDLIASVRASHPRQSMPTLAEQAIVVALMGWRVLEQDFHASAFRLGFVVTYVAEADAPQEIMQRKYLNDNLLHNAQESRLEFLHRISSQGLEMNRWVRVRGLPLSGSWPSRITFETDINTVPEQEYRVTSESAAAFFSTALEQVNHAIHSYSPR